MNPAALRGLAVAVTVGTLATARVALAEPASRPVSPPAAGAASPPASQPADSLPEPRAISLDEAVKAAVARNSASLLADAEVARAEALVVEARASYLPIVTGNAAYTRLEGDRTVSGRVTSAVNSFGASATVTWPVVNVKGWAQTRHAEDQADVGRASAAATRRAVAIDTARAYLQVVASKRIVEVSDRARDAARAHVDFAHARRTGGVGSQLDVVRAEEELADDTSRAASARVGLARAREALGILVSGDEALDAAEDRQLGPAPPLGEGLAGADQQRADVAAARSRLAAADAAREDDWTDYAPILALQGLAFFDAPQIDPLPRFGYQLQLALIVPIYDGGTRTGQQREREVNQIEARDELDATRRQARSEVRAAHEEVLRADEALAAARRSADLAARELELVNTGFRAGVSTSLEIIDAERRARDAATDAVIAEDTLREARLDLLAASGRFP